MGKFSSSNSFFVLVKIFIVLLGVLVIIYFVAWSVSSTPPQRGISLFSPDCPHTANPYTDAVRCRRLRSERWEVQETLRRLQWFFKKHLTAILVSVLISISFIFIGVFSRKEVHKYRKAKKIADSLIEAHSHTLAKLRLEQTSIGKFGEEIDEGFKDTVDHFIQTVLHPRLMSENVVPKISQDKFNGYVHSQILTIPRQ